MKALITYQDLKTMKDLFDRYMNAVGIRPEPNTGLFIEIPESNVYEGQANITHTFILLEQRVKEMEIMEADARKQMHYIRETPVA